MRREEAREIPGGFGDPARFVEAMPGVVPTTSGLQAFYVRGAPPESTGYFIDGVPVPALYHIGFGPSVVHPGIVDRVELFSGAAPSYYGRAIGATIAADTTEPAKRFHGEANLRLLDVSAMAEAPFADGRGSAEVSGRLRLPRDLLPLFAPGVGLTYWDYQARATWKLSDHDRIGVFVFGSNDQLTQAQTNDAGAPYTAQLVKTEFPSRRPSLRPRARRREHVSSRGNARRRYLWRRGERDLLDAQRVFARRSTCTRRRRSAFAPGRTCSGPTTRSAPARNSRPIRPRNRQASLPSRATTSSPVRTSMSRGAFRGTSSSSPGSVPTSSPRSDRGAPVAGTRA